MDSVMMRYVSLETALESERSELISRGQRYAEGSEKARVDWEKRKLFDITEAGLTETGLVWMVERFYNNQRPKDDTAASSEDMDTQEQVWCKPEDKPEEEPEARGDESLGRMIQEARECYDRELKFSDCQLILNGSFSDVHDYEDYLNGVESFGFSNLKIYSDDELQAAEMSAKNAEPRVSQESLTLSAFLEEKVEELPEAVLSEIPDVEDIPELPMPPAKAQTWQKQSIFILRRLVRRVDHKVDGVREKIKTWRQRLSSGLKPSNKRVDQLKNQD